MTSELQRMQAQLVAAASHYFEQVRIGTFYCFFNPDDPGTHANYAMPSGEPPTEALSYELGRVEARFRQRKRQPRVEYLADVLPDLGNALTTRGYHLEMQSLLMRCTPDRPQLPAPRTDLRIERLAPNGSVDQFHAFRMVQWKAFGGHGATPSLEATAQFRQRFVALDCYVAWQGKVAVAAGSLTPAHNGVAEVAGIATLPGYQRQGIGTVLTARIMQDAFAEGVELLFLTAANAGSGRIYARLGFQPCGHGLAYQLAA